MPPFSDLSSPLSLSKPAKRSSCQVQIWYGVICQDQWQAVGVIVLLSWCDINFWHGKQISVQAPDCFIYSIRNQNFSVFIGHFLYFLLFSCFLIIRSAAFAQINIFSAKKFLAFLKNFFEHFFIKYSYIFSLPRILFRI